MMIKILVEEWPLTDGSHVYDVVLWQDRNRLAEFNATSKRDAYALQQKLADALEIHALTGPIARD